MGRHPRKNREESCTEESSSDSSSSTIVVVEEEKKHHHRSGREHRHHREKDCKPRRSGDRRHHHRRHRDQDDFRFIGNNGMIIEEIGIISIVPTKEEIYRQNQRIAHEQKEEGYYCRPPVYVFRSRNGHMKRVYPDQYGFA